MCSSDLHLHRWFGPTGFQNTTEQFDFRVGGEWRFVMHAPDGRDIPNRIRFTEILPPTRLVYQNEIVTPHSVEVVAPMPDKPGAPPDAAYLTMTTCNPKYNNYQRMVVHARLITRSPHDQPPSQLGG